MCLGDAYCYVAMERHSKLVLNFALGRRNCLWFASYNFCRIHRTVRNTPAMEAGIADHVWDLKELLA
jgi:hypothetical protein